MIKCRSWPRYWRSSDRCHAISNGSHRKPRAVFASHLRGWRLPQFRQTPSDLRQFVVGHSFPCAACTAPRLVEGQQPLRDFLVADTVRPAIRIERGRVEFPVRKVGPAGRALWRPVREPKLPTICFDDLRCWLSLPPHSAIVPRNAS
jgi:hypothetical protein